MLKKKAILGGIVTIPTIDSDVELKIPAGTQPGEQRVKKKKKKKKKKTKKKKKEFEKE
jgi:hypothetical protein